MHSGRAPLKSCVLLCKRSCDQLSFMNNAWLQQHMISNGNTESIQLYNN